ncbi:L-lactate dehydrogenase B chain [Bienertia sinuspersici]
MKGNKEDKQLAFLQIKGNKGDKEIKFLQMKGSNGVKEIKSLQTWGTIVHVKQVVLDAEMMDKYMNTLLKFDSFSNDIDTNGNRRRRKTCLADVWNLPKGNKIVVEVNKENQPIGDGGKGCNKNNEKMIFQEVERLFLYPKSLDKWILKSLGHKWRDYKCLLKGKGYDDDTDINTLYDNYPDDDVEYDQWVSLVNFWRSEEGQRRINRSKESLEKAKVKPIHITGTKSHARVHEEMKKSSKKSPTRTQVYLKCHQHESEADITNQIKNVVTE